MHLNPRRFQRAARRSGMTLAEWVRQALRSAERAAAAGDSESKLGAFRSAVSHDFPAPDIDQMLAEVEKGYIQDSL
jgi:DNA-binding transcriptional LysR family regulator